MKNDEQTKSKPLPHYKIYCFLMVIGIILSWIILFYNHSLEAEKYNELLKKANTLYERKIYDESLDAYLNCLKVHPEEKIALERVCCIYKNDRKYDRAIDYSDELIKYYPKEPSGYIYKAMAYEGKNQYKKALSILKKQKNMKPVKEHYDRVLGLFDLEYLTITEPGIWVDTPSDKQVASCMKGKNPSLYRSDGKVVVTGPYAYIGYPSDEDVVIPVKEGEECFYIDKKGKRRLVPDEKFVWIGTFSEGLAPVRQEDIFFYIDRKFNKKGIEYEEAYPFYKGKAVVKHEGIYTEINRDFEKITEYTFEKVKAAPSGRISNFGLIIGTVGDKEYLYNQAGKRLSEGVDEIALPMEEKNPVAFKKGNEWGFMNSDGSIFMNPTFEGAGSFAEGMAPVKQDGKWGYISKEGKIIIPYQFDYAGPFSKNGTSWVRNHTGWSLLKLKCYEKGNQEDKSDK